MRIIIVLFLLVLMVAGCTPQPSAPAQKPGAEQEKKPEMQSTSA